MSNLIKGVRIGETDYKIDYEYLANKPLIYFIVNANTVETTPGSGVYSVTADKTFEEIYNAYISGANVILKEGNQYSPVAYVGSSHITFQLWWENYRVIHSVDNNSEWTFNQIETPIKIAGTPGDFVVIGDDGNPTTKTIVNAEEVRY